MLLFLMIYCAKSQFKIQVTLGLRPNQHLVIVWPYTSYLLILNISFLICKVKIIIPTTQSSLCVCVCVLLGFELRHSTT
jgi:hypothetical protein